MEAKVTQLRREAEMAEVNRREQCAEIQRLNDIMKQSLKVEDERETQLRNAQR